jgi:sedoheptulokinase
VKLAGLDIGTTTLCGLLLDSDSGGILSVVTERNSFGIPGTRPGEALQDPDAIYDATARILEGFRSAHGKIGGIGVACQMHGILYVDREGRAASPLYTWQDGRGERERGQEITYARFLSDALGQPLSTGMGFVTHYYNLRNGLVPKSAKRLCTIGDYVGMRLARVATPIMDATNAASLGCFDLRRLDFRRDAMQGLAVEESFFPAVSPSYPALGEAWPGTPVFAALGDNQGSFLGAVSDVRHAVLFNIGTGSQISLFGEECLEVPGIDTRPFPFRGYIGVGAALCGGRAYALLHDFFERTVRLFGGAAGAASWDIMNAASLSGAAGRLTVDTRFNGTRADPALRGSITGIGPATFTPEHLIVGLREGIADELLGFLELFPAGLRQAATQLVGSGNGIRLNPALRSIFESRLGMKMRVPAHREETSFGAALLAGCASGSFNGLPAAGSLIRYLSD